MTTKFKPGDKVKRKDGKQFSTGAYLTIVSEVGESHFGCEQVFIKGGGWCTPGSLELVEDTSFFGLNKKEFTQDQLEELASLVANKVAEFKKENEPEVEEVVLTGGNLHSLTDTLRKHHRVKVTFTKIDGVPDWSTLKGENI